MQVPDSRIETPSATATAEPEAAPKPDTLATEAYPQNPAEPRPEIQAEPPRLVPLPMLFAALLLTMFKILDPFAIDSTIGRSAVELAARVVGACYPRYLCLWRTGAVPGQDRIAVVLYNQDYMDALTGVDDNTRWPRPLGEHASLLRALVDAGAKAVFFDIELPYDRGNPLLPLDHRGSNATALADAIRYAESREVTVVMLERPVGPDRSTLHPTISAVEPKLATAEWQSPHHGLLYPFGSADSARTPAALLWRVLEEKAADQHFTGFSYRSRNDMMFLAWGVRPSARMDERYGAECAEAFGGLDRLKVVLPGLFGALREDGWASGAPTRPPCFSFDIFGVNDYLDGGVWPADRPSLAGKAVLVGLSHMASQDRITVPIHGAAAGVYLHATALDNLLTFGSPYRFRNSLALGIPTELAIAVAACWLRVVLLLATPAALWIGRMHSRFRDTYRKPQPTLEQSQPPSNEATPIRNAPAHAARRRLLLGLAGLILFGIAAWVFGFTIVQAMVTLALVKLFEHVIAQSKQLQEGAKGHV